MASSSSAYNFSDNIDSSRYNSYIRGPTRDIFAGVVEVVINEEGFKRIIKATLRDKYDKDKNMLHRLSLTDDSGTEVIIQKLKDEGLFESELKDYAAKTTRDKLKDLGLKDEEIKKADDGQLLKSKDITFLFNFFCYKDNAKIWKEKDSLLSLLQKVKGERNYVSHEKMQLTPGQLKVLLNKFKETLMDLLKEVIKLYPNQKAAIDQLEKIIHDGDQGVTERIREKLDPLSTTDYHIQRAETKAFTPQATECIQDESNKEIERQLNKHGKTVVCDWLPIYSATDTSKIAVPLEVDMEKEFHAVASPSGLNAIHQKSILKVNSPSGEEPTVTILSGEAGAGKTTLLSLITEYWLNEKDRDQEFEDLSKYFLVFYIEFRNLEFESLDHYLREKLKKLVGDYDIESVKKAIYKKPILFLCDGYDEKNDNSWNVFKNILDISSPEIKVLVTTRPNYTNKLTKLVNASKKSRVNLKICRLTEASVIECMKKVVDLHFKNDSIKRDKNIEEMIDLYNSMSPELKEITTIPLYAQLLTTLLLDDQQLKSSISSVTKLFLLLKEHKVRRLLDKCNIKLTKDDVSKFLKVFNKRALINHLQYKHEISSQDIEAFKECIKDNDCFLDVMSSFFSIKHSACINREVIYCYSHLTDQEFGAAQAITDDIPNGFDMIRNSTKGLRKYERPNMNKVYAFTAGILSETSENMCKYAEVFVKNLLLDEDLHSPDMGLLVELMSESKNNSNIIDAIAKRLREEKMMEWMLHDICDLSGIKALLHRVVPELIRLNFSDIDPDTVIDLIPMIKAASLADVPICLDLRKYTGDTILTNKPQNIRSFSGNLNQMSLIPHNIITLHLSGLQHHQIPSFNEVLPKLTDLKILILHFYISDISEPPVKLSRGETIGIISIDVSLRGIERGDTVAPKVASFLNSLLPQNPKKTTETLESSQEVESFESHEDRKDIDISIHGSRFTRDEARTIIDSLDVGDLFTLSIDVEVDITEEDKTELKCLAKEKGLGLNLF